MTVICIHRLVVSFMLLTLLIISSEYHEISLTCMQDVPLLCFTLDGTAFSAEILQEFVPRKMNTAKCEARSFLQHGYLLSNISGRTPKEDHKDLAVCDLKKKGRHDQRNRMPSRQTYEVYNVDDDNDFVVDDVG